MRKGVDSRMRFEAIPIAKLKPAPYNPRVDLKPGDPEYESIRRSLEKFGFVEPLVWNRHSGLVVGGHQRLKVMRDLGYKFAYVSVVDIKDEAKEKALNVALNKIGGRWDEDKLLELFENINDGGLDMTLTGFNMDEIDSLLGIPAEENDEEIPALPKKPITKRGDLWSLGTHRLLCGDATEAKDIQKLDLPHSPDVVFTDPPYGISYKDLKNRFSVLKNDDTDPAPMVASALSFVSTTNIYLCCNWRSIHRMMVALESVKNTAKACIVWDKGSRIQNLDLFAKRHEFILYAGDFGGEKTVDEDVWLISRETRDDHPTAKPIELCLRAIKNSTKRGDLVYDPFVGSGSTLIACEKSERVCFAIEIDPAYCDVVVKRWENFTGKKAKRA